MKINLKNSLLKGTIILTAASITCRILGFFFRIFITRLVGSQGMGIYQLIMPLSGIIYAACIAGVCTAITRFTAENNHCYKWMLSGILISFPLSVICTMLFYFNAEFISTRILMNTSCINAVKMLSFSFPFATLHSCIGAYFLGLKKVNIPAFSQLLEQNIRILCIIIFAYFCADLNQPLNVSLILLGNLCGDIASTSYNFLSFKRLKRLESLRLDTPKHTSLSNCISRIITYSLPLTLNRVLMQLLSGGEAILIPVQLILFGLSHSDAIGIYGILAGMAIPFISFPCAITNSLSVMLLPEISGAQSKNNNKKIAALIKQTIKLCLILGLFFTLVFSTIGPAISCFMFKNPTVGTFVSTLAWICPFQYLAVTLGSILNGLGKTTSTCIVNICGILIRIVFLIFLTPNIGISGYLYGLLCGQIVVCILHILQLNHMYHIFTHE